MCALQAYTTTLVSAGYRKTDAENWAREAKILRRGHELENNRRERGGRERCSFDVKH